MDNIHVECGLQTEFFADGVDHVELLPAKELDGLHLGFATTIDGYLGLVGVAAHVAIGCRRAEDGVLEAEALHDGIGAQVEQALYAGCYLAVGEVDLGCAIGVYV